MYGSLLCVMCEVICIIKVNLGMGIGIIISLMEMLVLGGSLIGGFI